MTAQPAPAAPRPSWRTVVESAFARAPQLGAWIGLVVLMVVLTVLTPDFLSVANLTNVLQQAVETSLLALGMTFVILTAGIDLSVAASAALSATVFGMMSITWSLPSPVAVLGGLAAGAACGLVNGLLITLLRIPPFIATLGTLNLFRGIAYQATSGVPLSGLPPEITAFGTAKISVIPVTVIIAAIAYAICWFVLKSTKLGAYAYTIGGNARAARYVGIPVKRYLVGIYIIAGVCAALAGMILSARVQSVQPTMLTGAELDAVAAVVVGGTSLFGGRGSVIGTVAGALVLSSIRNGLNLMAVSPFVQMMVIGVVVILAVGLDRIRARTEQR